MFNQRFFPGGIYLIFLLYDIICSEFNELIYFSFSYKRRCERYIH